MNGSTRRRTPTEAQRDRSRNQERCTLTNQRGVRGGRLESTIRGLLRVGTVNLYVSVPEELSTTVVVEAKRFV